MASFLPKRRHFWLLSIVGTSALFVAALFLVKDWHLVLGEYHSYRLDRAETFEEAKPWLDLLTADAEKPGASALFLSKLGTSHQLLTCWFFRQVVSQEPTGSDPLARDFLARLERDEELLKSWSQYVRWDLGDSLWILLDEMAFPQHLVSASPVFPCGVGFGQGFSTTGPDTQGIGFSQMGSQHREYRPWLLDLPIGWFLGMWPLPSVGDKSHEELASWLDQLRPFQRLLVYDEKLGRCKRPTEAEPLPALTSFRERGLPVPKAPLPGWKGAVPASRGPRGETFLPARFLPNTLDMEISEEE